jgi:hypothetical protein
VQPNCLIRDRFGDVAILLQNTEIWEFEERDYRKNREGQIKLSRAQFETQTVRDTELLKRAQEFQSKEPNIAQDVLSLYPSDDRGSLAGNETRRGWGGGWYR